MYYFCNMKYSRLKLLVDLFFCFIFLPMIVALVPIYRWITDYPTFAITLLLFLYFEYFAIRTVKIPDRLFARPYWRFGIIFLILFIFTYLLSRFPYPQATLDRWADHPGLAVRMRSQTVWFLSLLVMGYSMMVALLLELYRRKVTEQELREKQRTAELALYRAQINPHFLFNTLNTLYGLVVCHSDKTEDAFIRFSNLIKYTYSGVEADRVAIKEEIAYIENYIELQKLRLNEHTRIDFKVDISNPDELIPPMIIISFVENAFKYGTSTRWDCSIEISISQREGVMEFNCINDIITGSKEGELPSIGIANTMARLERIYEERYRLDIDDSGGKFRVSLILES